MTTEATGLISGFNSSYFSFASQIQLTSIDASNNITLITLSSAFGGGGIRIRDDQGNLGMFYHDDYSAAGALDPRWIPDRAWVQAEIAATPPALLSGNGTSYGTTGGNGFYDAGGTVTGDINFASNSAFTHDFNIGTNNAGDSLANFGAVALNMNLTSGSGTASTWSIVGDGSGATGGEVRLTARDIRLNSANTGGTIYLSSVSTEVQISNQNGVLIDTNFSDNGAGYNDDYSTQGITDFGDRWIPDIGWINSKFATQIGIKTPTSTGSPGETSYDSGFLYTCVATDTWVRHAVDTTW